MKVRICLVALCFLIFHCSAAYGQTPKKDDRSAEWEYKQLSNPYDELLNHYARDGWEIATAAGGGGDSSSFYKVILKRSKSHPLFGTKTEDLPRPEPTLSCDGFTFQVYAGNVYSGSFSISLTDPAYKKIMEDRKQADRAKKREGFTL
jgi:hypothetical protein